MIRLVIITVSDKGSKGEREDKSGQVIKEMITEIDGDIVDYKIIPDERAIIKEEMKIIADSDKADLVLTTGGTGIPEKMRMDTVKITPMAALSRAKAGIRGKTLIVNLPGSPKAVRECLESIIDILPHGVDILRGNVTEHNHKDE